MTVSSFTAGGNDVSYNNPVNVTFEEDTSSNIIKLSKATGSELEIIDNSGGVVDASLAVFVDDLHSNTNKNYKFYDAFDNSQITTNLALNDALKADGVYIQSDENFYADTSFDIVFKLGYHVGGDFSFNSLVDFSNNTDERVDSVFKVGVVRNTEDDKIVIDSPSNGKWNNSILRGEKRWPLGEQLQALVTGAQSNDINNPKYADVFDDVNFNIQNSLGVFQVNLSQDASNAGFVLSKTGDLSWSDLGSLTVEIPNSVIPENDNNKVYEFTFQNTNFASQYTYKLNVFKTNAGNERRDTVNKYEPGLEQIDILNALKTQINDLNRVYTHIKFHNIRDDKVGDNIDEASLFFGDASSQLLINNIVLGPDASNTLDISGLDSLVYKPYPNYYRGYSTDEYEHIAVELSGSSQPNVVLDFQIDVIQTFTDYNVADASITITESSGVNVDTSCNIDVASTYLTSDDIHSPDYNDLLRNEVKFVVDGITITAGTDERGAEDICLNRVKFLLNNSVQITHDTSVNNLDSLNVTFNGGDHFFGTAELTYHFEPADYVTKDTAGWSYVGKSVTYTVNVLPNRTDVPNIDDLTLNCSQDVSFQLLNDTFVQMYNDQNKGEHENSLYSDYNLNQVKLKITGLDISDTIVNDGSQNAFGILSSADYATALSDWRQFDTSLNDLKEAYETAHTSFRTADEHYLDASNNLYEKLRVGIATEINDASTNYQERQHDKTNAYNTLLTAFSDLNTKYTEYRSFIDGLKCTVNTDVSMSDIELGNWKVFYIPQPKFHGTNTVDFQFVPIEYSKNNSRDARLTVNVADNNTDALRLEDPEGQLVTFGGADTSFNLADCIKTELGNYYQADQSASNSKVKFTIDPSSSSKFNILNGATKQYILNNNDVSYNNIPNTIVYFDASGAAEGLHTLKMTMVQNIEGADVSSNELHFRVWVRDDFLEEITVAVETTFACVEDGSIVIPIDPSLVSFGLECDFVPDDYYITVGVNLKDASNTLTLNISGGTDIVLRSTDSSTVGLETLTSLTYVPTKDYYSGYNTAVGEENEQFTVTLSLKNKTIVTTLPDDISVDHYINVQRLFDDAVYAINKSINLTNILGEQTGVDLPIYEMFNENNGGDIKDQDTYTDYDSSGSVWIKVENVSYGDFDLFGGKGTQMNKSVFQWINNSSGDVCGNVIAGNEMNLRDYRIRFNTEIYDEYFGTDSITFRFVPMKEDGYYDNDNSSDSVTFTVKTDISGGNDNTLIGSAVENNFNVVQGIDLSLNEDIKEVLSGATSYKVYHTRYGDSGVTDSKDLPENGFYKVNLSGIKTRLENNNDISMNEQVVYRSSLDYYSGKYENYKYNAPLGGYGRETLTIRYTTPEGDVKYSSFVVNVNKPLETTVNSFEDDLSSNFNFADLFDPNIKLKHVDTNGIVVERFKQLSEVSIEITDICNTLGLSGVTFKVDGDGIYTYDDISFNKTLDFNYPSNYYNYDACGNDTTRRQPDFVKFKFFANEMIDDIERKLESNELTVNFQVTRKLDDRVIIKLDEIIQEIQMGVSGEVNPFDPLYFYPDASFTLISQIGDDRYTDFKIDELDIEITGVSLCKTTDYVNTLSFNGTDISNGDTYPKLIQTTDGGKFTYTPDSGYHSNIVTSQPVDYVKFKYVSKVDNTKKSDEVTIRFLVNETAEYASVSSVVMNSNQYVEFNLNDALKDSDNANTVLVEFVSLNAGKLVNLSVERINAGEEIKETILKAENGVKSGQQGYKLNDTYRYYPQIEYTVDAALVMKLYEIKQQNNTNTLTIDIPIQKVFKVTAKKSC